MSLSGPCLTTSISGVNLLSVQIMCNCFFSDAIFSPCFAGVLRGITDYFLPETEFEL